MRHVENPGEEEVQRSDAEMTSSKKNSVCLLSGFCSVDFEFICIFYLYFHKYISFICINIYIFYFYYVLFTFNLAEAWFISSVAPPDFKTLQA